MVHPCIPPLLEIANPIAESLNLEIVHAVLQTNYSPPILRIDIRSQDGSTGLDHCEQMSRALEDARGAGRHFHNRERREEAGNVKTQINTYEVHAEPKNINHPDLVNPLSSYLPTKSDFKTQINTTIRELRDITDERAKNLQETNDKNLTEFQKMVRKIIQTGNLNKYTYIPKNRRFADNILVPINGVFQNVQNEPSNTYYPENYYNRVFNHINNDLHNIQNYEPNKLPHSLQSMAQNGKSFTQMVKKFTLPSNLGPQMYSILCKSSVFTNVNKAQNYNAEGYHIGLATVRKYINFRITAESIDSLSGLPKWRVVGIAGSVNRTAKYGLKHYTYLNPILSSADIPRANKAFEYMLSDPTLESRYYSQKVKATANPNINNILDSFLKLNIKTGEIGQVELNTPTVIEAVDVSYYPGVIEWIARSLARKTCFKASLSFHVYDTKLKCGVYPDGEGSWTRSENGLLTVTMQGNQQPYIHPDLFPELFEFNSTVKTYRTQELYLDDTIYGSHIRMYVSVIDRINMGSVQYIYAECFYHCVDEEDNIVNQTADIKLGFDIIEDLTMVNKTYNWCLNINNNKNMVEYKGNVYVLDDMEVPGYYTYSKIQAKASIKTTTLQKLIDIAIAKRVLTLDAGIVLFKQVMDDEGSNLIPMTTVSAFVNMAIQISNKVIGNSAILINQPTVIQRNEIVTNNNYIIKKRPFYQNYLDWFYNSFAWMYKREPTIIKKPLTPVKLEYKINTFKQYVLYTICFLIFTISMNYLGNSAINKVIGLYKGEAKIDLNVLWNSSYMFVIRWIVKWFSVHALKILTGVLIKSNVIISTIFSSIFVYAQDNVHKLNEPDWAIGLIYLLGLYLFLKKTIKIEYHSNYAINKYIKEKTLAEKKKDDEVRMSTKCYYKSCVQPEYWKNNNYDYDATTNKITFTEEGEFLKPIFGKMNSTEFAKYISKNCNCKNPNQLAGYVILPLPKTQEMPKIINYHSCCLTSTTALKRSAAEMPDSDPVILEEFKRFLKIKIYPILDSIVKEFEYSSAIWWNHITTSQRQQVLDALKTVDFGKKWTVIKTLQEYGNFVKSEDQTQGPAESKTRNICNVGNLKKLLAGPVCYTLEKIAKCKIKSYVSGKSYEEKGYDLANIAKKLGEDCVKLDGDGSAFDSCQKIPLKNLVDDYLYKKVCEKIEQEQVAKLEILGYAIPPYAIRAALLDHHAVIKTKFVQDLKLKTLVTVTHDGTTHSGDMDTTLANTIRMWCYTEFVAWIARISENDYETRVAGDDNTLYVSKKIFENKKFEIINAYQTVYTTRKDKVTHGLGQVIKFLKVGKIEDGDFCSTSCFKTTRNGDTYYRILRIPSRYFLTFAYMYKSDSLTPGEYMYTTGQAELKWAKGLPIFEKIARWKMRHGYNSHSVDLLMSSVNRIANYQRCSNLFNEEDDLVYKTIELSLQEKEFLERWNIKNIFNNQIENTNISVAIRNKILELYGIKDVKQSHIDRALKTYESKFKNTILGNHNLLRSTTDHSQDYQAYCETLLERYGITTAEIEDFEQYLDTVDPMSNSLEHPVLMKITQNDKQVDLTKYFNCPEKFKLSW